MKKKIARKPSMSFLGPIQKHSRSMSDSGFEFAPKQEMTPELRLLPAITKPSMHRRTKSLNFEISMVKKVHKKQLPSLQTVLRSLPSQRKLHAMVPPVLRAPTHSQLTAPFVYQSKPKVQTQAYPAYPARPQYSYPIVPSSTYPSPVNHYRSIPSPPKQKALDWLANIATDEKLSPKATLISPKSSVSSPQVLETVPQNVYLFIY
jgi:hypothetical protein